uniref:Uncharacterized protein n=1 Tax=Falco tinnunculus TaxID=100819 RepID=A0A8C4XVL6_FALTI
MFSDADVIVWSCWDHIYQTRHAMELHTVLIALNKESLKLAVNPEKILYGDYACTSATFFQQHKKNVCEFMHWECTETRDFQPYLYMNFLLHSNIYEVLKNETKL